MALLLMKIQQKAKFLAYLHRKINDYLEFDLENTKCGTVDSLVMWLNTVWVAAKCPFLSAGKDGPLCHNADSAGKFMLLKWSFNS